MFRADSSRESCEWCRKSGITPLSRSSPSVCIHQTSAAQALYQKLVARLRELPYSVLDVACTAWCVVSACCSLSTSHWIFL